jgi:hypothetical protein
MKVIHYAIIALHVHDREYEEDSITDLIINNDTFTTMGSATNTLTFFNNDSITNGGTITLPPLKTSLNTKD